MSHLRVSAKPVLLPKYEPFNTHVWQCSDWAPSLSGTGRTSKAASYSNLESRSLPSGLTSWTWKNWLGSHCVGRDVRRHKERSMVRTWSTDLSWHSELLRLLPRTIRALKHKKVVKCRSTTMKAFQLPQYSAPAFAFSKHLAGHISIAPTLSNDAENIRFIERDRMR